MWWKGNWWDSYLVPVAGEKCIYLQRKICFCISINQDFMIEALNKASNQR